jgi:hypothetical protein
LLTSSDYRRYRIRHSYLLKHTSAIAAAVHRSRIVKSAGSGAAQLQAPDASVFRSSNACKPLPSLLAVLVLYMVPAPNTSKGKTE